MTPDIEQHIVLMLGTLLAIGETLRRVLKRRRLGNLVLTLSVTDENSSDCPQNTNSKTVDVVKTDSNDVKQQPTEQQGRR